VRRSLLPLVQQAMYRTTVTYGPPSTQSAVAHGDGIRESTLALDETPECVLLMVRSGALVPAYAERAGQVVGHREIRAAVAIEVS